MQKKHLTKLNKAHEKDEQKELLALQRGKKMHPFKKFLLIFACFILLFSATFYYVFDVPSWQTLDLDKITFLAQTGALYDKDNNYVSKIQSAQNRTVIALNTLPKHVVNAFLAAEDLRFYSHNGYDLVRIFGALFSNLKTGRLGQGASTITQQLIKLSHLNTDKTFKRKFEEISLAIQLEKVKTKDEILSMYLNFIYFGRGAYGIEAAAQAYFGISSKDLSPLQSACLASIIKAPTLYAPHLNEKNNKERRNYVLNTMLENNMLTQSEFDQAIHETLVIIEKKQEEDVYGWYVDACLEEAENVLSLSSEELLASGYKIFTALDQEKQKTIDAQYLVTSNFPKNAKDGTMVESAMACVDTKTGAVLAIVGGRNYAVKRGLNRATQMRRQPGSALKPLAVYAPAIDVHGYTAASVLHDAPTKFGNYQPRNSGYQYYGNVTIRTALQKSLNIPAVLLLDQIGIHSSQNYLQSVGIPLDERDSNLSLALGSMTYGTSPVELAASYIPFANGGTYYEPYFIERIEDATGNILYRHKISSKKVLKESSAYLMTSLLRTVTTSGTGSRLSLANTPVAGKTGTVNMTTGGNRDIWMAAYNSEISTAFWMGFDRPDESHKLGTRVSGGDNTALLASNFFKNYYKQKSKPAFQKADNMIWLEIDKKAIEWQGEAMLASNLTPKIHRYSEVFLKNNHPTKQSNVWNAPQKPSEFYVSHNKKGNPLLVIKPTQSALFRIQRDAIGESKIIAEINGKQGEKVYFADTNAKLGVEYTYRVTPINQELLENGVLLEGNQLVVVARAKSQAEIGGASLFKDISDLLFPNKNAIENQEALNLFFEPLQE